MDFSISASPMASAMASQAKLSPEPVNREGREATAKQTVDEDAVNVQSNSGEISTEVEFTELTQAAAASAELSSSISAQPGLALGAQAQVPTESALLLLR